MNGRSGTLTYPFHCEVCFDDVERNKLEKDVLAWEISLLCLLMTGTLWEKGRVRERGVGEREREI